MQGFKSFLLVKLFLLVDFMCVHIHMHAWTQAQNVWNLTSWFQTFMWKYKWSKIAITFLKKKRQVGRIDSTNIEACYKVIILKEYDIGVGTDKEINGKENRVQIQTHTYLDCPSPVTGLGQLCIHTKKYKNRPLIHTIHKNQL